MSKTLGLIRDRSPLCSIRSDDMCVRTDENPEVFVLCGFRRPGANARGGTRKNLKKWRLTTFSQSRRDALGRPSANRKEARICTKAFRPFEEAEKAVRPATTH